MLYWNDTFEMFSFWKLPQEFVNSNITRSSILAHALQLPFQSTTSEICFIFIMNRCNSFKIYFWNRELHVVPLNSSKIKFSCSTPPSRNDWTSRRAKSFFFQLLSVVMIWLLGVLSLFFCFEFPFCVTS